MLVQLILEQGANEVYRNAKNEYEWKIAYKEKPHCRVIIGQYDFLLDRAKPEDLDELGVTILIIFKGMEAFEWLGKVISSGWELEWGPLEPSDRF